MGQSDARLLAEPARLKPSAQQEKRDAAKDARNQSLFTAAGLRQVGGTDVKSGA
jgi:hypothetical protein